MTPRVVVDVGNSRIKWGLCSSGKVQESVSLPHEDPIAWQHQIDLWRLSTPVVWAITGVHPGHRDSLASWLRARGDRVAVIEDWKCLPLRIQVDRPDHVGIDRLLDAVAVNSRRKPGNPALAIDAGSAVTVDLVNAQGAFEGGAILPGFRLMAKALHDYTALLPLVGPPRERPSYPAKATPPAMVTGIFWAIAGGIGALIKECTLGESSPQIFLTGGDAQVLHAVVPSAELWPTMTLEGVRLTAEAMS
jgi:type III pantothenate kinase